MEHQQMKVKRVKIFIMIKYVGINNSIIKEVVWDLGFTTIMAELKKQKHKL